MDLEREIVMKILIVLVTLFVERTTAMVPVLENATTVAQKFDFHSKYERTSSGNFLLALKEKLVPGTGASNHCRPTSIYIFFF